MKFELIFKKFYTDVIFNKNAADDNRIFDIAVKIVV